MNVISLFLMLFCKQMLFLFIISDINELKVFVDLASISAGENDLDVDRVACFHDAVLGYSSMLYDLKPDADFRLFKDMLKKLWKALDNDPNLPKKLVRVSAKVDNQRKKTRFFIFLFTNVFSVSV